jgi:acetyltransferase
MFTPHPPRRAARISDTSMQPYPAHLVQRLALRDGSAVTVRPIRPEDARIEQDFVRNLSSESRYYRFMDSVRELSPGMLQHFIQVDYVRHMALIAVSERDGAEVQVGVARYVVDQSGLSCEFSIVIADEWQRRGLGERLMRLLMDTARSAGVRWMYGEVLAGNQRMLKLTAKLNFAVHFDPIDPRMMRVEIAL